MGDEKKKELTIQDLVDIATGKTVASKPTLPPLKMHKNRFVGGSQDGKVIEMPTRPMVLQVPIPSLLSESTMFFDVEVYELHRVGRKYHYDCVGQSSMMGELVGGAMTPDRKNMF